MTFKTCSIRPLVTQDLPMLLEWRNHDSIRQHMLTQHTISWEEHQNWFRMASDDIKRRLLIIEEHNLPLGYVQFSNVYIDSVTEWGFFTRPDATKGSGKKLGLTSLTYAFGVLAVGKVCGRAIETNTASIAFHKSLGFKREHILHSHVKRNNQILSMICFGLKKHDWLQQIS
jgi:UDP-4-amino-4,6-dideoxy-N-acetyl-beta-L-altrosamine N-acetyltransferase